MNKYYVTTSIPYVNADPHIGFALELIYADVLARTARARGYDVIFSTGTDEHGGKIAEKAAGANQEVQQYTDTIAAKYASMAKLLAISNDRFVRTTGDGHVQRVSLIWKALSKDIYKSNYSGWYCTGDEAFFTDTEVKANNGICPAHNRPYEKIEEENYFFKLSKYSAAVKQAIQDNTFQIVPETRRNEILALLDRGLEDVSVSRPKDKITWGIPVPGDSSHVIYVWFEALMNYITVLGYPEHDDFKNFWPADVQVIGKDILRFHAAIWPAMLMSLGIALPKRLFVHGFVTVDGKKISKTLGNVIDPVKVVNDYGVDALRYFLLRHIPSYEDGDFSWTKFAEAYNNELANELGNLIQRVMVMANKYLGGNIKHVPPPQHDTAAYFEALDACRFDRAMDDIWDQVRGLNQYIDEEKPWQLAATNDLDHLNEVLAYLISSIREIADMLLPFLPLTAAKIKSAFGQEQLKDTDGILFPKHD